MWAGVGDAEGTIYDLFGGLYCSADIYRFGGCVQSCALSVSDGDKGQPLPDTTLQDNE